VRKVITATIKDEKSEWTETYTEGAESNGFPVGDDPTIYLNETVAAFNNSLRPGEIPRTVVSSEITEVPDEDLEDEDEDDIDDDEEEDDDDDDDDEDDDEEENDDEDIPW
jgi:hypothetical protein